MCLVLELLRRCYTEMSRTTCLATPLQDKSQETMHDVTYLATSENATRQVAETVAESSFCNDLKQLSGSLRSHTSLLPCANACAIFVQCFARQIARNIAQRNSAFSGQRAFHDSLSYELKTMRINQPCHTLKISSF